MAIVRESVPGWLGLGATARGVCFAQFGDDRDSLIEQLQGEFPKAEIVPSTAEQSPELDAEGYAVLPGPMPVAAIANLPSGPPTKLMHALGD